MGLSLVHFQKYWLLSALSEQRFVLDDYGFEFLDDIYKNWTYDTAAPQPCLNLLSWVAELSSGVGGIVPKVWFTMLLTLLLYYRKLWITRIIA